MQCPKCHRPLEDGEVYVCCADMQVQWRCTECSKVSEGFAFPFGNCPLCGGTLQVMDDAGPRAAEDAGTAEAVRTAYEIELGGMAFYGRAGELAKDPAIRRLFAKLAAMEEDHLLTLERRYHAPKVEAPARLGPGLTDDPADGDALFKAAIRFEQRAHSYYTERAERPDISAAERQMYAELAAEENEHIALLMTEYRRWQEGKPGVL